MPQTIDIRPHPQLVRAALAHCKIPLTYGDEHTVSIPAGPGWDSNGNMTIPEGHVLGEILSATVSMAMVKHIEDTMVLPSNASALREIARVLDDIKPLVQGVDAPEMVTDAAERLRGIANNLDKGK